MATTEQARAFIAGKGEYLAVVGDQLDQWTVVSREYLWFKYTRVYFTVVASDPDGDLWQFTISESTEDGTAVDSEPVPVSAVAETKKFVSFQPRLIRRSQEPT